MQEGSLSVYGWMGFVTDLRAGLQSSGPRDKDGRSAAQAAREEVRQDDISDSAPLESSKGSSSLDCHYTHSYCTLRSRELRTLTDFLTTELCHPAQIGHAQPHRGERSFVRL